MEDEYVRLAADFDDDDDDDDDDDVLEEKLMKRRSCRLTDLADKSFGSTIFGKIKDALEKLVNLFVVFAFNGQRFDFIVIGSELTIHYQTSGSRVRLSRDGLAIRGISVGGNLHFQEASVLLSPGSSLDGLGRLVGLEIQKFR